MKKRVILLTVFASIMAGVLSAFAVSHAVIEKTDSVAFTSERTSRAADTYFTQNYQSASLPDLTQAAQKGVEAVVNIEVTQKIQAQGQINPFEFFFGPGAGGGFDGTPREQERKGGGSGVLISQDGYIVTNNHVIEGASSMKITLNSGDSYSAKVIGADPSTDIALLKIEATELPHLQFGNSDALRLGEWVLAVGNPYGLNSTVTAGIVSAKGRTLGAIANQLSVESFIQTDAAVNPGNSGGALMTIDESLVGINTLIKSPTGSFTGYSFAVPSNIARKVVGDLRQYGLVQRAMLGIAMQEITQDWIDEFGEKEKINERGGVFIAQINPDGAAAVAGIKKGDVIVELNGTKINTPAAVQEIIAGFRPGDKVKITVKRAGEVKPFEVTLRNRTGSVELLSASDVDIVKELGGEFLPVSEKVKKSLRINRGLQVVAISPGGVLAKAKVKVGYIITSINDRAVGSIDDLNRITDKIESIEGIYPDGRIVSYQTL